MNNIKDKFLVVDIVFKDGKGLVRDCVIFENGEKGQMSIQDKGRIKELLDNERNIYLQNSYANIVSFSSCIYSYNIKEINKDEF